MFYQVNVSRYFTERFHAGQSQIARYDPRGRPVKYNAVEEEDNVEEEGDAYQEQLVLNVDVSDEESNHEIDHPNDVADDFELGDDINDEYITKNHFDDDDDMSDPFNNNDFGPDDDTNEEVDDYDINDE